MRKYNGVYKIPIKKHTKVKRPKSIYLIYTSGSNLSFDPAGTAFDLVKDIKPIYTAKLNRDTEIKSTDKGLIEFMKSKPSLLTRVKERFKRKGRR